MIVLLILVGSARFFLHLVIHASRSVGSFAVNAAMRLAIGSSWYSKKVWRSDSRVARRVIFVNNCALSDSDLSMVPTRHVSGSTDWMTREPSENVLQKPFVGKVKRSFAGIAPSSRVVG